MRRIAATLVASLIVSTVLLAQSAADRAATELEPTIRQAWVDWVKKDRPAVEKIMTEDVVEIWVDGKGPRDKKSSLEGMQQMNITNYSLSDFKFKPLGRDARLAIYRANVEFSMGGPSMKGDLAVSEVWVRHGKEWKLVHYQETEIK